jgi:hypothetical protein
MTTPQLPAAPAPWAEALSVLEPRLAVALGPLVRQLDQLVTRRDSGTGTHGQLDGYGGLTRRGTPSQMLVSELALAQEVPWEFLRRAATAELLYLAPSYIEDQVRGRVCVLVDCGPDQLGAGRLVQLAALVVMHRRAVRRGSELMLGVLGDEPGNWRTGDIKLVLRTWLTSRRTEAPDGRDLDAWVSPLDSKDETWVLAGRRLGAQLPGRRKTITSAECAWGPAGATAVEVVLDGDRVELALPHGEIGVHALRGAAFRVRAPALVDAGKLRFPAFPSAAPWLVGRGRDAAELVAVRVPHDGQQAGSPRRHRFAGPLFTASFIGRRLVALVLVGDELRVEVRGKHLGHVDGLAVAPSAVDLDIQAIEAAGGGALPCLVYDRGDLVTNVSGTWWRLAPGQDPRQESEIVAVLPDVRPDVPRIARTGLGPAHPLGLPGDRPEIVLGPGRLHPLRPWIAVQRDDKRVEVADFETNTLLLTVPGEL